MEQCTLVRTEQTADCRGRALQLSYFLVSAPALDGCAEQYGVEIRAVCGAERSAARVKNITMSQKRVEALLALLAENTVTPTELWDVVQQWL